VLGAGAIFGLSSITGGGEMPWFPFADKLAHLAVYCGLGLLVVRAVSASFRLKPLWSTAVTVLAGTIYGVTDELHQSYVPGRAVEGLDLLADTLGVALACAVWFLLLPRFSRKTR
jgi:VanZ family protein